MKNLPTRQTDKEYQKIVQGYGDLKRSIDETREQLNARIRESSQLDDAAERAGVDVYTGDVTAEEAEQVKAEAEQAKADIQRLGSELDRMERAYDTLQSRLNQAKIDCAQRLRPAWSAEHRRLAEAVFEKLLDVEADLAELAKFEAEAQNNGIELARIGRGQVLEPKSALGGTHGVRAWIDHMREHHGYLEPQMAEAA